MVTLAQFLWLVINFTLTLAIHHQTPLLPFASKNISLPLFTSLEELSRLVDIAYCVGSTSPGIHSPFLCSSRCQDFPTFTLVTVSASVPDTHPVLSAYH
jgi:hypothetical protein